MTKVLLVEDDPIIAFDMAELLVDAGFTVAGPAATSEAALALVPGCDVAVLDVNLGLETSERVAEELLRCNIPFLTLSGYNRDQHPPVFSAAPLLLKPVRIAHLIAELRRLQPS